MSGTDRASAKRWPGLVLNRACLSEAGFSRQNNGGQDV